MVKVLLETTTDALEILDDLLESRLIASHNGADALLVSREDLSMALTSLGGE